MTRFNLYQDLEVSSLRALNVLNATATMNYLKILCATSPVT